MHSSSRPWSRYFCFTLFAGGLLLALRYPSRAQGRLAEIEAKFTAADADKNGELSPSEAKPYAAMLSGADTDGNGGISWAETEAHFKKLAAQMRKPSKVTPAASEVVAPYFSEPEKSRKLSPQVLTASAAGVGRQIPDLALQSLSGTASRLSTQMGSQGLVVAWLSPSCPVGKRYLPELKRLESAWKTRGVSFVFPCPAEGETDADLKSVDLAGVKFRDSGQLWQTAFQARMTTEVFLLDPSRTLIYRGAIDDQYGVGYSKEEPKQRFLADALESLHTGTRPAIAATEAPGCALEAPKALAEAKPGVTYHKEISRLINQHCVECHRSGGVAPFKLETLEQVSAKAKTILRVLEDGTMPPWFAAPQPAGHGSPWLNDRSLSVAEKALFRQWVDAGKPEGNAQDAPTPRRWPEEWAIGKPDQVWQLPAPQVVKAEGTMPYQKVRVETLLKEDKWVQAWEVRPTARQVVHHVLVFELPPGQTRVREDNGEHLASYVPGGGHAIYAPGTAKKLLAGTTLVFELHYTPNGQITEDRTQFAVRYASAPPEQEVRVAAAANMRIQIPPQAANHAEVAILPVPKAVQLLSLSPHMHVRGKAFRYELEIPGQPTQTLLDVPHYDFNWQISCRYAQPLNLPVGSRIKCTAWYDNSAANPANPDPSIPVKWGPQTTDEMMLGYVEYLVARE